MKKLVLLFAAVVLAGTAAFAADHYAYEDPAMCAWQMAEGQTAPTDCEYLLSQGQPLSQKCCWEYPLCANYTDDLPPTCESFVENGLWTFPVPQWCCWQSRENAANLNNAKGNNDKGGKKTPVQSPKNKKSKTAKVQTNTKKVTAKK